MMFQRRVPGPPLDRFVEAIWSFSAPPRPRALERVLPTGAAQLIVNLKEDETRRYDPDTGACERAPGAVLVGVQSRFAVIDTDEQERVVGVSFRPGGTVPFVGVPAGELRDRDVALADLWGRARTAKLGDELHAADGPAAEIDALERALLDACRPVAPHETVRFALEAFGRRPAVARVADVARAAGLSPKRFIEHFTAAVGLTPKRYCRILRFQQAVTAAHRGDRIAWTRLALDCGYADQSHFIHDFRALTGLTPTMYEAGRTAFRNHVKFLQDGSSDA